MADFQFGQLLRLLAQERFTLRNQAIMRVDQCCPFVDVSSVRNDCVVSVCDEAALRSDQSYLSVDGIEPEPLLPRLVRR